MRRFVLRIAIAFLTIGSMAPLAGAMGMEHHFDCDFTSLTSLADLAGGGSITSKNGELVFDDFEVTASGSVNPKLSLYKVIALVDGFKIIGPIAAADGNAGDLNIEYTVSSTSPITQAALRFNGMAHGTGASASVIETFGEPVDIELFVFATGDGGRDRRDSVNLEGFTELRVIKDILVDSAASKGFAGISWITQRFESAPEPVAMLLIGGSLVLVVARRRPSV